MPQSQLSSGDCQKLAWRVEELVYLDKTIQYWNLKTFVNDDFMSNKVKGKNISMECQESFWHYLKLWLTV